MYKVLKDNAAPISSKFNLYTFSSKFFQLHISEITDPLYYTTHFLSTPWSSTTDETFTLDSLYRFMLLGCLDFKLKISMGDPNYWFLWMIENVGWDFNKLVIQHKEKRWKLKIQNII